ncbi:MAG: hemolysin family protein [Lachnospiraceae bacterium]
MEEDGNLLHKMKCMFSGNMEEQEDVAEEIISMVDEGHEQGVFVSNEAEMIRNIFEYGDKNVKDIMTHRKNIIAIDSNQTLEEALTFILEENYSRFPVYEGDIDTITGILYLRDVTKCYLDTSLRSKTIQELKEYLRPVSFVPETKSIDKLFKEMQSEKNHMAVVLDEYGQTSGIVAMEDILEEIVGNILDEYDEDENFIVQQQEHTYLVNGMTELEDLEDILEIVFDEEDCETLNGFLIHCLDRIPNEDETCMIEYKGYHFQVLTIDNNMIESVQITKDDERELDESTKE